VTRFDFQRLADVRIAEAGVLLAAGMWDGAYYLAGYAVECALKACIAKLTRQDDFPDKDAARCYTHKIDDLVVLAKLGAIREADSKGNGALKKNWATVKDWAETSRYDVQPKSDAEALYAAITDPNDGVLPWIKRHW
jgi:HEPN domain-containing protein